MPKKEDARGRFIRMPYNLAMVYPNRIGPVAETVTGVTLDGVLGLHRAADKTFTLTHLPTGGVVQRGIKAQSEGYRLMIELAQVITREGRLGERSPGTEAEKDATVAVVKRWRQEQKWKGNE